MIASDDLEFSRTVFNIYPLISYSIRLDRTDLSHRLTINNVTKNHEGIIQLHNFERVGGILF